jgi:hypothetical protein
MNAIDEMDDRNGARFKQEVVVESDITKRR